MTPNVRDLLEAPERVASVQPDAMAGVLGELVLLLARLLVQIPAIPTTAQAREPEEFDRLLTVREAATLLSLRRAYVYDLIRQRALPSVRIGKYVRVRSCDLQAWITRHREEAVDGKIQPGLGFSPSMNGARLKARGKKSR